MGGRLYLTSPKNESRSNARVRLTRILDRRKVAPSLARSKHTVEQIMDRLRQAGAT